MQVASHLGITETMFCMKIPDNFTYILSINSYNPKIQTFLFLFYRWGNWLKELNHNSSAYKHLPQLPLHFYPSLLILSEVHEEMSLLGHSPGSCLYCWLYFQLLVDLSDIWTLCWESQQLTSAKQGLLWSTRRTQGSPQWHRGSTGGHRIQGAP